MQSACADTPHSPASGPRTVWQTPGGCPLCPPPSATRILVSKARRAGLRWRRVLTRLAESCSLQLLRAPR